jgi:hypothetical protein
MIIRKLAASAAAMAMLIAPVAAQASAASSLSVAGALPEAARAGSSLQGESDLEGLGTGAYIIGAIVIGLAIWGIIELTDDDSDSP